MPYQALQCFSCQVMQVKEVRKSSSSNSKWSCVLCSEKQSVRKVYCRADTAKEVRNFVQRFNLARGQALEAEGRARLGFESPTEDSAADHSHQEDEEEEQVKQSLGSDSHTGQKKSVKWDKFLPAEEEQACSGDEFQQSADDMKLTTTLPEPSSRRKTRPSSSSSPPPKRPERDSRDDAKHGSFISSGSTKSSRPTYSSRPDNSLRCQQGSEYGYEDRATPGKANWKCSIALESKPISLPASDSDCSAENVKSCHAQELRGQTSKWSKYLT